LKIFATVCILLALSIPAFAQAPPQTPPQKEAPNTYRGYEIGWNLLSYAQQGSIDLYGGDVSLTIYPWKSIGIVADVAVESGTYSSLGVTITNYRFGPKFVARRGRRVTTFGEVLFGGSHLTGASSSYIAGTTITASQSTNGLSLAFGGGLDIAIKPWFAFRPAQFDYSYIYFNQYDTHSGGFRISGGLVFRFGE